MDIKELIDTSEIISFDIFDTLVLRPFIKPQDVFSFIENVKEKTNFCNERIKAEKKAIILNLAKNKKEACSIDDIYKLIHEEYRDLKEAELELEQQIAFRNEEVYNFYLYAKKQNKKIILTSDMYLSSEIIGKILTNLDITSFDGLFISSETGVTKASGKMYDYIISKYDVTPNKILHIGDNENSDIYKASEKGLSVYHYKNFIYKFLNAQDNFYLQSFYEKYSNNPVVSALIGLVSINSQYLKNNNYWETLGFNIGGILAVSFVQETIRLSKKLGISDLFFIARDGYVLTKIFNILNNDNTINGHYVYINRVLKKKYEDAAFSSQNEFYNYINNIELKDGSIGLVDSCANTFSAQEMVKKFKTNKKVTGFYLSCKDNNNYDYYNLSSINWEQLKLFNWNFIEFLLTSIEPPIIDIKNGQPVYDSVVCNEEKNRNILFEPVCAGELNFSKNWNRCFSKYLATLPIEIIFEYINKFWENMTEKDKFHLSKIKHPIDNNQSVYVSIVNSKKDISALLRNKLKK